MNVVYRTATFAGLSILLAFFSACASKEIDQLQGTVSTLENRIQRYQQTTLSDSEITVTTLQELKDSINQSFREIRSAQTNLQAALDQVSTRLSTVERQGNQMQSRLDNLERQTVDNYASHAEELKTIRQNLQQTSERFNTEITTIRNRVDALQQADRNIEQNAMREIRALKTQLTSLDNETRKIFERILKELGAEPPASKTSAAGESSGASGNTYAVQSGDTLSGIAAKFGVETRALQDLNGIDDPSKIYIGQTIRIP